ncbi:alanine racemase [Izhakiella capsodis]|uniref:Alanine racemase n=1 Tax=Izhakiella capsodis TaxID=1367852 RepID=A0A1I4Z9R5_9GAMM|nr:catabolic alanine racemase DadX [Izhakiella capsodis]SFN46938.1 alanine racemase [Izhakiella capsodis]
MARPIVATIHSDALRHNLSIIRQVASESQIWSVVKANGYGHGLERIWQSLRDTDGFALLNLEEAILLREKGWKKPILLLEGFFSPEELETLDRYRLTTCVHSNWQIQALAQATLSAPLDIYLKVNSGMNRLGFQPEQVNNAWHKLRNSDNVGEITLMSHFACAEEPEGIQEPLRRIELAAKDIVSSWSLANSAATLWHPHSRRDWVRPGIILYGASPSGRWQDIASTGLRPAMSLQSEIIGIQNLRSGETVGYGRRYQTSREQRIGIVACGYADGYPRHAPTGTPVYVDGVRTCTVGAISMDMLAIDLTPCPEVHIGTRVELWGNNIRIDDIAQAAGTVGYELMCALAPRVPVVVAN